MRISDWSSDVCSSDLGASSLTIGTDGTVSATMAGDSAPTVLGRIETARFINPAGLEAQGNNIYKETAASGQPQVGAAGLDGRGPIRLGALEGSIFNLFFSLFYFFFSPLSFSFYFFFLSPSFFFLLFF